MCWEPNEMCTRGGMCKHTRKFPLPQNIKTEFSKCNFIDSFTTFSGTKFARLQSALPSWFPLWYTAQKMFWYLLKSNYFILWSNTPIVHCYVTVLSYIKFFFSSHLLLENFWHHNFPVQMHCWYISSTNLRTYCHILMLCRVLSLRFFTLFNTFSRNSPVGMADTHLHMYIYCHYF